MKVRGKNVFLSGPMTGCDHNGTLAFMDAHERLNSLGARSVYDPAYERYREISDGEEEHDHAYYMRKCIQMLTCSDMHKDFLGCHFDVLVSLPGWQSSEGAKLERDVAEAIGVPCVDFTEVE